MYTHTHTHMCIYAYTYPETLAVPFSRPLYSVRSISSIPLCSSSLSSCNRSRSDACTALANVLGESFKTYGSHHLAVDAEKIPLATCRSLSLSLMLSLSSSAPHPMGCLWKQFSLVCLPPCLGPACLKLCLAVLAPTCPQLLMESPL